ncbi:MAG TPA: hypothetical protein VLV86_25155 [Vicinamibacterales bacterium]|nr:hypothetical protein [Vicinamibacterales bacterium]
MGYWYSGFFAVDNLALSPADSNQYGRWSQYFSGLDVNVQTRARSWLTLVEGLSTAQTVADACDVRAHLPELSPSVDTVPRIDIQVSSRPLPSSIVTARLIKLAAELTF